MEQLSDYGLAILYKCVCLFVGLAFAFMGYRLFLAGKTKEAGSIEMSGNFNKIRLINAAPGIFFSLFGMVLIVSAVFQGISKDYDNTIVEFQSCPTVRIIPDKPPS